MAGGTFDKSVGKVRPGTYINFEASNQSTLGSSDRGTVLIPLINHSYGPEKEFITISNESVDSAIDKLGYSVYDDDPSMLLIREAFKNASTVIVYIAKAGTKATGTGGGLSAQAKYGGSRGNALSYSVAANPVAGFDVSVYLDGSTVEAFEGVTNVSALVDSKYITFTASEGTSLEAVAGVSLTGGTDGTAANSDIAAFLDDMESVNFNTLAFPVTEESLLAACVTKIKYLRENVGRGVKAVVPDYKADYEGIINVTNSVIINGVTLSDAQATAWVAGADASASNVQSNTHKIYVGAESVANAKTHEQAVAAIQNGEFFFSYSENGDVIVEYDINSLTSFTDRKDKSYSKNRVLRVFDSFAESIRLNFPPNKYSNNENGWDIMDGMGRSILKQFFDAGAIRNVDYDSDFAVVRGESKGDSTYFNVGLQPVDSAEKLYFTVKTR
ncbi:MAG: hypothetical protein BHV95_03055 [Clostridiales bacterium Nov_37_41]|nr:MAG: hypothetical protein BHV95_03055 [Clostridiales bacterium Nov_37_41]